MTIKGDIPPPLKINIVVFAANGQEFLPVSDTLTIELEGGVLNKSADEIKQSSIDLNNPVATCGDEQN